jgi:hypothetical protein
VPPIARGDVIEVVDIEEIDMQLTYHLLSEQSALLEIGDYMLRPASGSARQIDGCRSANGVCS